MSKEPESLQRLAELTFNLPHIDAAPPASITDYLGQKAAAEGINLLLSDSVRVTRHILKRNSCMPVRCGKWTDVVILVSGKVLVRSMGEGDREYGPGDVVKCISERWKRIEALTSAEMVRISVCMESEDAPGDP